MPELYLTRRVEFETRLAQLDREAAEIEAATRDVKQADDVAAGERAPLLARISRLHDGFLQLSTDYRELISQQEYKLLEDRTETMARLMAVLEGRSRL